MFVMCHSAVIVEKWNVYMELVDKPEWKKQLEGPGIRWDYN
jgi:hypothetical protein